MHKRLVRRHSSGVQALTYVPLRRLCTQHVWLACFRLVLDEGFVENEGSGSVVFGGVDLSGDSLGLEFSLGSCHIHSMRFHHWSWEVHHVLPGCCWSSVAVEVRGMVLAKEVVEANTHSRIAIIRSVQPCALRMLLIPVLTAHQFLQVFVLLWIQRWQERLGTILWRF